MALVLLISAVLMIRTFLAMRDVDPGFSDARIAPGDAPLHSGDAGARFHGQSYACRTTSSTSWRRFPAFRPLASPLPFP